MDSAARPFAVQCQHGRGVRDVRAFALAQRQLTTRETHGQVAVERRQKPERRHGGQHRFTLHIHQVQREVFFIQHTRNGLIGRGNRVEREGQVGHVQRLLQVQFAAVAVLVHAIPVVEAVGDVGRLLDFVEHDARADGMDAARRNEAHVARMHRHAAQERLDCRALFARGAQGVKRCAGLDAVDELTAFRRVQNQPCLGLAEFAVLHACSVIVVRVYLHGQRFGGINQLQQQREGLLAYSPANASP